jgi:hypothetical protein
MAILTKIDDDRPADGVVLAVTCINVDFKVWSKLGVITSAHMWHMDMAAVCVC